MKNLLKVSVFLSLILAVACTKTDTVTPTTTDLTDTTIAVDELVAQGAGGGGDSIPNGGRHGFGPRGRGHHEHPSGVKGDSITIAQLPAAAQAYLTTNNLKDSVKSVFKVTLSNTSVRYVVRLTNRKHLHFDANGALVNESTRGYAFISIALTNLPAAAQTYLAANTDVTKITHVIKITKADGTIQYGVRTSDNKHFLFNAAGVLLKKHG